MRSGYVVVKREREAQEREKEKEEERERARERDEREGGRWRERVSRLYCACQWLVLRWFMRSIGARTCPSPSSSSSGSGESSTNDPLDVLLDFSAKVEEDT